MINTDNILSNNIIVNCNCNSIDVTVAVCVLDAWTFGSDFYNRDESTIIRDTCSERSVFMYHPWDLM